MVGAAGHNTHATKATVLPADQSNHRHTGIARVQQGAHHFGDGNQTGIGFVQAHTTGLQQQHHPSRAVDHGAAQQSHQLGAVNFAHTTAHEFAFLRGHINRLPFQQGMADGHAVIKGRGHTQLG